MAGIGGVSCTFVRGHTPIVKQRIETWAVPGLDGVGAAAMGRNDSKFTFTAILFSNAAGIIAWKIAIEALQGTIVSIVNDLGVTYINCLITEVGDLRNTPAIAPGGITQRGEIQVSGVVTR